MSTWDKFLTLSEEDQARFLLDVASDAWKRERHNDRAIFADQSQRELATRISKVCEQFDFLESRMFKSMTNGKSEAYVQALRRKFLEPIKRAEMKNKFIASFHELENSDKVFDFLSEPLVNEVLDIRRALQASDAI